MSRRVLVVTADWVGERMAGPAIRAVNLARELARRGHEVTLAVPNGAGVPLDGVTSARLDPHDARGTVSLALAHDAVVAQRLPSSAMVSLAGSEVRVVYDLYDHVPHELMAAVLGRPVEARDDLQLIRQRLCPRDGSSHGRCLRLRERTPARPLAGSSGGAVPSESRGARARSVAPAPDRGRSLRDRGVATERGRSRASRSAPRSRRAFADSGLGRRALDVAGPLDGHSRVAELSRTQKDIRLVFLGLSSRGERGSPACTSSTFAGGSP